MVLVTDDTNLLTVRKDECDLQHNIFLTLLLAIRITQIL
jgi:hypothetical protein